MEESRDYHDNFNLSLIQTTLEQRRRLTLTTGNHIH